MGKYKITKEQCQETIKGICSHCGGELTPIETVDNSNDPTFWSGCEVCQMFQNGVTKQVYLIAKKLVEEGSIHSYTHVEILPDDNCEIKQYKTQTQISGICDIVMRVLTIKEELCIK